MIIAPLLALVGEVGTILTDKFILTRYKVNIVTFNSVVFIFPVIYSALLLILLNQTPAYSIKDTLLLVTLIVLSVTLNLFYAKALRLERVEQFEAFNLFIPLATIILAGIVFPSERNVLIIFPSAIAAMALIFSHVKKHHLILTTGDKWIVGMVLLAAVENVLIGKMLHFFDPLPLFFLRSLGIALVFNLFFRPSFSSVHKSSLKWFALSGLIAVLHRLGMFYGFSSVGISYTMMVLTLAPFILLFLDHILLKDKIHIKNIVSIFVIVISLAIATFYGLL